MISVEKIATLAGHSGSIYALARGGTAQSIFSGGADKVVAEWNLETCASNPSAIRTEHTIYSLLNLGSQLVIGTIAGGMHVIDLESKKEVRHLKFHDKGIFHLAFIQPQNLVCAACADGSISVWNATDWSLVRTLKISSRKVRRLAVNVSGSLMAAACGDGMVRVFETVNFALVQELDHKNEGVNSVAFFENDDLITGGKDAHLRTWAAHNGFELKEDVPAHNFAIYDLIIEPNGNFLATVSRDKTVKIWPDCQLESPIRLDRAKSEGHLNSVNVALWIPEENVLATAGDDRSIVLWKIT